MIVNKTLSRSTAILSQMSMSANFPIVSNLQKKMQHHNECSDPRYGALLSSNCIKMLSTALPDLRLRSSICMTFTRIPLVDQTDSWLYYSSLGIHPVYGRSGVESSCCQTAQAIGISIVRRNSWVRLHGTNRRS